MSSEHPHYHKTEHEGKFKTRFQIISVLVNAAEHNSTEKVINYQKKV